MCLQHTVEDEPTSAAVFSACASHDVTARQGKRTRRAFAEVLQHGKVEEELVESLGILRRLPRPATNTEIFLRRWTTV